MQMNRRQIALAAAALAGQVPDARPARPTFGTLEPWLSPTPC